MGKFGIGDETGRIGRALAVTVLCALIGSNAMAQSGGRQIGAGNVIVHSALGGTIFGFDIDQNGTEGVLSEALGLNSGNVLAAVETFDQKTGKILKMITKTQTQDDFLTMGVVGNSAGLVEHEHVISLLHVQRTFDVLNPLGGNQISGSWTPPIDDKHIVTAVSRNQGANNTSAVYALDLSQNFTPNVFTSNVVANTFGPVIKITDDNFTSGSDPALAYDSGSNQIVLAHSTLGNPFVPPVIGLVDATTGDFTSFNGAGLGDVNGIAVDPETHILCTTTEIDFSVQFYDLTTKTGFSIVLPGATNQLQSASDVEFDPIHKLFLVAQGVSSTAFSGSSILVFDELGNFKESIDGFNFSNAFKVVPTHIALNPKRRTGYVDGPDSGVTQLQSFSY